MGYGMSEHLPTKEVLRCSNLGNKNPRFPGILDPLTDSNRRPLLTMDASPCCYMHCEKRLVAGFPCNPLGFFPCSTLSSKDSGLPREAANLSPEPNPNERLLSQPWHKRASRANLLGRLSSFDWWHIEARLSLRADSVASADLRGSEGG